MRKYQVPEVSGVEADDEIVEWLHTMTQEWDGDESGINIYPPLGPNGEVSEADTALIGDWVVEEDGRFFVVKADVYDEFMSQYRWQQKVEGYSMLEAFIDVTLFFEEGNMVKAKIKKGDDLVILSDDMFFTLLGKDAHDIYEIAATEQQNMELNNDDQD